MWWLTAFSALVQDALLEVLPAAAAVTGSGSQGGVFLGQPPVSELLTVNWSPPCISNESVHSAQDALQLCTQDAQPEL